MFGLIEGLYSVPRALYVSFVAPIDSAVLVSIIFAIMHDIEQSRIADPLDRSNVTYNIFETKKVVLAPDIIPHPRTP